MFSLTHSDSGYDLHIGIQQPHGPFFCGRGRYLSLFAVANNILLVFILIFLIFSSGSLEAYDLQNAGIAGSPD